MIQASELSPFWKVFVQFSQNTNSFYGWYPAQGQSAPQPAGFLPLEKIVDGKFPLSGFAPFWTLKSEQIEALKGKGLLELYGVFDNQKTLTLTCHYLDDNRASAMVRLLGKADGQTLQYMLSSGRTVLSCLDSGVQGFKFCGTSVARLEQKADRKMQPKKVRSTVQINSQLTSRSVIREDRGFTLRLEDFGAPELSVLYRDYASIEKKDRLLVPAFTLCSNVNDNLRNAFFGAPDTDMSKWMNENVVPFYARLIEDSFFVHGYHFEIHQQNIFFLMCAGKIEDIFYQDSCDVLEDVAYRYLVLKKPAGIADIKRFAFIPGVGEYSRLKTKTFNSNISQWYRFFLDQFGLYQQSINVNVMGAKNIQYDFFAALALHLRGSFARHLETLGWSEKAQGLREYSLVFDAGHDLFKMLNAFRDLMLKCSVSGLGVAVPFSSRKALYELFSREPLADTQTYFSYGIDFATLSDLILSEDWEVRRFDDDAGTAILILANRIDASLCHVILRLKLKGAVCF